MPSKCALALLVLSSAGCASEPSKIRGRDSGTFPELNVTWVAREPGEGQENGGLSPVAQVDLDVWSVRGSDIYDLKPNATAVFRGRSFVGPMPLAVDWRATDVTLAFRGGAWLGRRVCLEGIAGLEGEAIDLEVQHVSQQTREFGPCLGAQARFVVFDHCAIVGRWQEAVAIFGRGLSGAFEGRPEQWRIGVLCDAIPHVELFGGFNWWIYKRFTDTSDSDVILRQQGPMVSLRFVF